MNIEDELLLTEPHFAQGFSAGPRISIAKTNVMDLMGRLNAKGVVMKPKDAEKEIKYKILGKDRETMVPLQARFENPIMVLGYTLRNDQLEIRLKDYISESGASSREGGSQLMKRGVACSLKFQGTYSQGQQVETAKSVLKDFYLQPFYDLISKNEDLALFTFDDVTQTFVKLPGK